MLDRSSLPIGRGNPAESKAAVRQRASRRREQETFVRSLQECREVFSFLRRACDDAQDPASVLFRECGANTFDFHQFVRCGRHGVGNGFEDFVVKNAKGWYSPTFGFGEAQGAKLLGEG
jgi:hypothetical protein